MSGNIFLGKWRIVESIPCSDENYLKTVSPHEASQPLYYPEDTPPLRSKGASVLKPTNSEVSALLVSHDLVIFLENYFWTCISYLTLRLCWLYGRIAAAL